MWISVSHENIPLFFRYTVNVGVFVLVICILLTINFWITFFLGCLKFFYSEWHKTWLVRISLFYSRVVCWCEGFRTGEEKRKRNKKKMVRVEPLMKLKIYNTGSQQEEKTWSISTYAIAATTVSTPLLACYEDRSKVRKKEWFLHTFPLKMVSHPPLKMDVLTILPTMGFSSSWIGGSTTHVQLLWHYLISWIINLLYVFSQINKGYTT